MYWHIIVILRRVLVLVLIVEVCVNLGLVQSCEWGSLHLYLSVFQNQAVKM